MTTSDSIFITVLLCNLVKIRQDLRSLVIIFIHLPTNEVQVYGGHRVLGLSLNQGGFSALGSAFWRRLELGGRAGRWG